MGDIFGAIAKLYGYKTLYNLITENAGLATILVAFIFVCLVFFKLLNRQFPIGGHQSVRAWIFKTIIIFMICAFVFICGFTVFYERKKLQEDSRVRDSPTRNYYINC